jgi:hypothetical protein
LPKTKAEQNNDAGVPDLHSKPKNWQGRTVTTLPRPSNWQKAFKRLIPSLATPVNQCAALLMLTTFAQTAGASEDAPHRPFAYWADIPAKGELIAGFVYSESEAYHMWAAGQYHNVTTHAGGESYGIDINQGFVALQYGLTERWALDLNLGYTSVGWRYFDNGHVQSTSGLMDVSFGVRYQLYNETNAPSDFVPTTTFRMGAILPGTYDQHFAFAPGLRSIGIEPELLLRKHFGWPGFGAYGDGLFRWNRTIGNSQYIIALGVFQQIKGWEVDLGYKHLQTLSGSNILFPVDAGGNNGLNIIYPRDPRENYDAIEFGFSYVTSKQHWRYGFHLASVVDGNNTDSKLWIGGSLDIPFGLNRDKP